MSGFKLRYQAFSDLLSRYGSVFRYTWARCSELDSPPRLAHEAQFLPAALALQETPPSPAPRVTMWTLIVFAALALLWAIFGRIDVVASAQGKIIPSDKTKIIQPLETATVHAIHVRDGQFVKAGEVLVELDATTTTADQARLRNDLIVARLQVARAEAILVAISSGRQPNIKRIPGIEAPRVREAELQLMGLYSEYIAKLNRVDADIARREAEIRSTREIISKLEQTAPIARQRADDFKRLVDQNFVSRHGYLEKEQIRIEQEGDLATQRSRLGELEAALRETRGEKAAIVAETRRVSLDSLNEGRQKAATFEQELLKADTRNRLMRLTAPVDGTVQQLAIHTRGGVVTPAQALMLIVPKDDPVEVEAFIENKDIGFVKPEQEAEIKIETFQFTRYGTIHGEVISVSHDAIEDEKRGLIYSARVRMERSSMRVDGTDVRLSPGMAVTVEVKTGKRRVIEYFLSPLIQATSESMRER